MIEDQGLATVSGAAITPRRWPTFRLKSLLILIGIMAIPLGWCSWKLQQNRKERWAAAELAKFSGILCRTEHFEPELLPPPLPEALCFVFGDDFFEHVAMVQVLARGSGMPGGEQRVSNETLANLRYFPKLDRLFLFNPEITDASLDHLRRLKSLQLLDLGESGISKTGAAELRKTLPNCLVISQWDINALQALIESVDDSDPVDGTDAEVRR